ncbi:hypothetical protein M8998_07410 [Sphingobacterium sp. lm-10]|uniref:hypothetical protein n=1 Tax=Sphingobacterium sp. lm-10 TaxID=2944904 RepID=UPI0020216E2E|nr:hypothetical protein [Sphingobacterium sp. lm-10]MCL7987762.1 hypothetical protein [Sphingobacterium sp. lm-10]
MSITFENISTDWFNDQALRLPNYKVGRVNFGQGRSYIRLNQDGAPVESPLRLYTSLTTAINACAPMEQPLLEWYVKHGLKEAGRLLELSQHYGTMMHLEIGKFLINGEYDFDRVEFVVEDYLSAENYYQPDTKEWPEKLRNDLAAFIQFYIDYNIVPLGIEYVLLSDRGYGTLIDLVCNMTIQVDGFSDTEVYKSGPRKGQPKECKVPRQIRAIINFKSGRHGFYRTNGLQLEAERQLWEENFPDLPLDAACNWSPKEWRGDTPTYNFKDWTGDITTAEVDAVMTLADIRYASKAQGKTYTSIGGTFSIADRGRGLSGVIRKEGIGEYVGRKFGHASPDMEPIIRPTAKAGSTSLIEPTPNPLPF